MEVTTSFPHRGGTGERNHILLLGEESNTDLCTSRQLSPPNSYSSGNMNSSNKLSLLRLRILNNKNKVYFCKTGKLPPKSWLNTTGNIWNTWCRLRPPPSCPLEHASLWFKCSLSKHQHTHTYGQGHSAQSGDEMLQPWVAVPETSRRCGRGITTYVYKPVSENWYIYTQSLKFKGMEMFTNNLAHLWSLASDRWCPKQHLACGHYATLT